MPERLVLTSSFEPIAKGDTFEPGMHLPLHVTIQQYFTLDNSRPFLNSLMNYAIGLRPFEVTGKERRLFGLNLNVPVTTLSHVGKLTIIHAATQDIIERHGGELENEDWHGDGYNPHVTDTSSRVFQPGERAIVRSIEVIRAENGSKEVLAVLPFGDGEV